jgi:hypothetical protein
VKASKESFFGVVLVYISERKDENCKIECSTHITKGAGEMYSEIYSMTVLDDLLQNQLT